MRNKSINKQDRRKIEIVEAASMNEYIGSSTLARFLRMSHTTFKKYVERAGIRGLPDGRGMMYKKADVMNLRDKVASL